jgi:hypothetical protein
MSLLDTYLIIGLVVGQEEPFSISIAKSETVRDVKDLVKKIKHDTFVGTETRFLDLYHVEIPEDDELMANVRAHPLDSPLLATAPLIDIFPCAPKENMIHLLVKPSELHW